MQSLLNYRDVNYCLQICPEEIKISIIHGASKVQEQRRRDIDALIVQCSVQLCTAATSFQGHYGLSVDLIPEEDPRSYYYFLRQILTISSCWHPHTSFEVHTEDWSFFDTKFQDSEQAFYSVIPSNVCILTANHFRPNVPLFWPAKARKPKVGARASTDGAVTRRGPKNEVGTPGCLFKRMVFTRRLCHHITLVYKNKASNSAHYEDLKEPLSYLFSEITVSKKHQALKPACRPNTQK